MTVAELIAELQKRPPAAPVYVWEGDYNDYLLVDSVSEPMRERMRGFCLPVGAVVVRGT